MKTKTAEISTIDIAVEKLHISEHNTRQPKETDSGIKELSLSLSTMGQTAAILVRPHPTKKGHYEIAAGARRSVAARLGGLKSLRASVRHMSEDEFQTAILVDNLQRENPDPKAEAELLLKLHERGQTAVEIAAYMGKAETWVRRRMKLLAVDAEILTSWRNRKSGVGNFSIDMMELLGSLSVKRQFEIANDRWNQCSNRDELLKYIQRQSPSLKDAPFDLHDPKFFVKDCGPGCATDSSKQADIFDFKEGKKTDCARCLNGACFNKRLSLYTDHQYDELCTQAGVNLHVITETQIIIKGTSYYRQYEDYKWGKTGKPVAYVNDDGKISLRYLTTPTKAKNGNSDTADSTPAEKLEKKINNLQGKRWLLVREKLHTFINEAKHTNLSVDIDRVIATFGLPYKTEGSVMEPMDKPMWEQIFGTEDMLKCETDWSWKKVKPASRKEAIWPHVQEILCKLIPEPKRLMDAHLFEHDYRSMGKLIGFDIDAAKKAADLEIMPPKSFGNVDPHTLK